MTRADCDICHRRPTRWEVPIFRGAGGYRREWMRTERWCDPCYQAVIAKYPGEHMWPPFGVWLMSEEIPA